MGTIVAKLAIDDFTWDGGSSTNTATMPGGVDGTMAVCIGNGTTIGLSFDVGVAGFTAADGSSAYAEQLNMSTYSDAHAAPAATSRALSITLGIVPDGATELTISSADPVAVLFVTGANTGEFFTTQTAAAYADVRGVGHANGVTIDAIPADSVTIAASGWWFEILHGVGLYGTVGIASAPVTPNDCTFVAINAEPDTTPYSGSSPASYMSPDSGTTVLECPMTLNLGDAATSPTASWELIDAVPNINAGAGAPTEEDVAYYFCGIQVHFALCLDTSLDPFPVSPGINTEPFEFTHRWTTLGPLLLTSPGEAVDLLERHDQELEQHFADHGCGEFLYTFRWPTFYAELLAGTARAVDVMETRDQELEEASLHQGEGGGQTNDGSCVIELTHRWREILPLVLDGDARAWDLLEMRDREIEEARSACACTVSGGT